MNIYVGNLPFTSSEEELERLFQQYGEVVSVRIITHRDTGRSRGFGFVEMSDDEQARSAISALNGYEFQGRSLRVNESQTREQRGNSRRYSHY